MPRSGYILAPPWVVAQPSNVYPERVNAFDVSAVPVDAVWLSMVPVPPFALKVTVLSVGTMFLRDRRPHQRVQRPDPLSGLGADVLDESAQRALGGHADMEVSPGAGVRVGRSRLPGHDRDGAGLARNPRGPDRVRRCRPDGIAGASGKPGHVAGP